MIKSNYLYQYLFIFLLFHCNKLRNVNLGSSANPTPQKVGDKIFARNGYSGGNRNGFAVEKRDKTGRNIVDGKFISHV